MCIKLGEFVKKLLQAELCATWRSSNHQTAAKTRKHCPLNLKHTKQVNLYAKASYIFLIIC
jgi:hypothetical protein